MIYSCWQIQVELVAIEQILEWCAGHEKVDHMLLGIRMCIDLEQRRRRVPCSKSQVRFAYRHFRNSLVALYSVKGWPGTEFFNAASPLLKVRLDDNVLKTIVRVGPYLHCWTSWNKPPLPEDICLYREGAEFPTIVTVAHERTAWLITNKDVDLPGFTKVKAPKPKDLIFEGPCFSKDVKANRFAFMKGLKEKIPKEVLGSKGCPQC